MKIMQAILIELLIGIVGMYLANGTIWVTLKVVEKILY